MADPKTTKRKLTQRDKNFVDKVAKGVPAARAYVEVGHKSTANNRKSAMVKLQKPHIAMALEERKAYFREIANVEAKEIIGAQQEIAFASIEDALNDDGYLDFRKAKENGSAKLIKKISRSQTQYGENVAVEFYSRTDALSQLADMLGLKQAPKINESDAKLIQIRNSIESRAKERGVPFNEELQVFLDVAGSTIVPEIKEKLASELVN